MLTARSILSLWATSTATQCSAALPTIATTITPMKNSLRPTDSDASAIEPTRTSDITPTATPAIASITTDRRTLQPSVSSCCVRGVEEVAVGPQREEETGRRRSRSARAATATDSRSTSSRSRRARRRDRRQPAALGELEDRRHQQRRGREEEHQRLHAGGGRVEALPLAADAADQHRGAHDEQDVADDRADDRGLHDLVQPLAEREQRDDQLGRVAEGDVQQPADARARARRQLLGRECPSAPPWG